MSAGRERRWPIPYLDLTNTLFFFFVALFAIALLVISDVHTEAKKVDTTSRILITLTWRSGSENDMDIGVRTPRGNVAWFRHREADFVSLDHDNLGSSSENVLDTEGHMVSSPGRDEVMFVRQTMPGTYVVNVLMYTMKTGDQEPVTVTLSTVDQNFVPLTTRQLVFSEQREEHTAFRFTVNQAGRITSTDTTEELFFNEMLGTEP